MVKLFTILVGLSLGVFLLSGPGPMQTLDTHTGEWEPAPALEGTK